MTKGKGPGGRHDNMRTYTADEAQLVMRLVEAYAPRWTLIAKLVSEETGCERSAASVRNYYNRFQASKAIAERGSDIKKLNRCLICSQIKRGHICKPKELTYVTPQAGGAHIRQPAESLLALSAGENPIPPLAPAALELADAPGTSPLSTFSTVAPLSSSTISAIGSPFGAAVLHAAVPFAFSSHALLPASAPFVVETSEEAEVAFPAEAENVRDVRCLPIAECEVQEAAPTA